jgi:hypothetical protein
MLPTFRIEMVVPDNGTISLADLPFKAGQTVEVVVSSVPAQKIPGDSLAGTVLFFHNPTAPLPESDWNALA